MSSSPLDELWPGAVEDSQTRCTCAALSDLYGALV